jgi:cytochrome c oxidase assembly factor CtaG/cytochrome c551/c552
VTGDAVSAGDMAVAAALAATAVTYATGAARLRAAAGRRAMPGWRLCAFGAGWLTLALANLPAVHELAETRFSAHMAQHQVLMLIAAPLLVLGQPLVALLWALPRRWRSRMRRVSRRAIIPLRGLRGSPAVVWALAGAVLWVWHVPALFQAALAHPGLHAIEHLSFLAGAVASWWVALHGRYGRLGYGAAVLWLFTTAIHTSALGALLVVSRAPWYPLQSPGIDALEDQQLGGLLMWVPSGVVHAGAGLALFAAWLRALERRSSRRAAARAAQSIAIALLAAVWLGGCTGADETAVTLTGGDPRRGRQVITKYGCQTCHRIPGVAGAVGNVGPPLDGIALRAYIAGRLSNDPVNLITWIRNPQAVVPGNAMPDTGVTEQDGRDIAAYLYTLR